MGPQYPDLQIVQIEQMKDTHSQVGVAVLRKSKQQAAAFRFARYLGARNRGLSTLKNFGYRVVEGDEWSLKDEPPLWAKKI
jgi:molybdate transport system substrate-binding protein